MSDEEPVQPQAMQLPDGRVARIVDISEGVVNVDIDESSEGSPRSLFALLILAAGTIVLSVGVGGIAGVFAGVATAGAVLLVIGFLLALTT